MATKKASKTKQQAKANKTIAKANESALTAFPSIIRKSFETIGSAANAADASQEEKSAAALDILRAITDWTRENSEATVETLVKGYGDQMAVLALILAAEGNRFAESSENKAGETVAKLTGYGNNVKSIGKGVVEFELDAHGVESYRDMRKQVEALREERRREEDPKAAELADAKAAADEAWQALRSRVFELGEIAAVESLTEMLEGTLADVNQQIADRINADAEKDAAEAEAKAA